MKHIISITHIVGILLFAMLAFISCTEELSEDSVQKDPKQDVNGAEINQYLKFKKSTLKMGTLPTGPPLADLKMDKKIITLANSIYNRIRILLPDDYKEDVCGVYVKVEGSDSYFEVDISDEKMGNVIAFYFGIDIEKIKLPLEFKIQVVPYNCFGSPIDVFEREVKVQDQNCSLIEPNPIWNWISTTADGELVEAPGYSTKYVFTTNGCCMDGISVDCIANAIPKSQYIEMEYESYVLYEYDFIKFENGGTFTGSLLEKKQNLDYSMSNFCSSNPAYIISEKENTFWGEFSYNASTGKLSFPKIESTVRLIDLGALGQYEEYDRVFLNNSFQYEVVGCNFIVERSSLEGKVKERIYERIEGIVDAADYMVWRD